MSINYCVDRRLNMNFVQFNLNISAVMIILLLLLHITSITSTQYTTLRKNTEQKYVFAYANKTYKEGVVEFEKIFRKESGCISKLVSHAGWLKVVVVQQLEKYVKCYFFTAEPEKMNTNGSTYYIAKENECSGLCKSLVSCGKCKCYDVCKKKLPERYFCDCTKAVAAAKTCAEHYKNGQVKDGKYLINPDGEAEFPVFCKMKFKFKKNNELHCEKKTNYILHGYFLVEHVSSFTACYSYILTRIKDGESDIVGVSYHTEGGNECYATRAQGKHSHANMISCVIKLKPVSPDFIPIASPTILMLARRDVENIQFWDRPFEDYESGFGNVETWIGLKQLHIITSTFRTDLRVVMTSKDFKDTVTTTYHNFRVKWKETGYRYTYDSFDSYGARDVPSNFAMDRLNAGKRKDFLKCGAHFWWVACDGQRYFTPTSVSKDRFGFGAQDITGIAMFLITL